MYHYVSLMEIFKKNSKISSSSKISSLVISASVTATLVLLFSLSTDVVKVENVYGQGFQNLIQGSITRTTTESANATGTDNATTTLSFSESDKVGSYAIVHSKNNIVVGVAVDVPVSNQGNVYEAWLVDERSGYYHSLGLLDPNNNNKLSLSTDMVNPYAYDKIVVTEEPADNLEPKPSETIVGGSDLPEPFGSVPR
jgi:Anti-sigma-K factor rskA